jgi:creatinine amidohydrolase/Fe(II)-dependent formamide hydrolase-like protein
MISWTQPPRRAVPRPRTGETPIRHVRVEDGLWGDVTAIAKEQGRSITAVVIDALRRYVTWYRRQKRAEAKDGGE